MIHEQGNEFESKKAFFSLDLGMGSNLYNAGQMSETPLSEKHLSVGEVAKPSGVSTDTIRYYEKLGLLPKAVRQKNGYRLYPSSVLDRVRAVRAALTIGFTLKELSIVFKTRDKGGAPCRQVRALAEAKLHEAERRIEEMMALRERLKLLIKDWDRRLDETLPGERAGLLDLLETSSSMPSAKISSPRKVLQK